MSVILGIDLGTSSVKGMLLDSFRGVLAVESGEYDVKIPRKVMRNRNRNNGGRRRKRFSSN